MFKTPGNIASHKAVPPLGRKIMNSKFQENSVRTIGKISKPLRVPKTNPFAIHEATRESQQ